MRRRIMPIVLAFVAVLTFTLIPAFAETQTTEQPQGKTTIILSKKSTVIYRKGTVKIKPSVTNPNGKTTYKSGNTKVASVSAAGLVKGRTKGTAAITVKNGDAQAIFRVKVKNPSLNKKKLVIYLKQSKKLKITGKIGKATFKSTNKKVAGVSKSGKITACKKGKCTIRVKTNGITLNCKVIVRNPRLSKKKFTTHNSYKTKLKVLGGKGKIKWRSSNKQVARVSKKGVVKAKKAGKCTIFAKRNGITMKCRVKVSSKYEGYPKIPDFGACYGKYVASKSSDDNGTAKVYKAKKAFAKKYVKEIKKKGFFLYQSDKGFNVYINDDFDIVGIQCGKGYVCVVYANAFD